MQRKGPLRTEAFIPQCSAAECGLKGLLQPAARTFAGGKPKLKKSLNVLEQILTQTVT